LIKGFRRNKKGGQPTLLAFFVSFISQRLDVPGIFFAQRAYTCSFLLIREGVFRQIIFSAPGSHCSAFKKNPIRGSKPPLKQSV
jgi:hypothetical protein